MGFQEKISAYAVLKGPDTRPETNPSFIAASFRRNVSMNIATETLGQKIAGAESERPARIPVENDKLESVRSETTRVGLNILKRA